MSDPLPQFAPWPITGAVDPDGTVSATLGSITYTAAGEDTKHATLALARKLVEAGYDLDAALTVDGVTVRLRQAI